ncbi:MAG: urease accessory protein UreE [Gammaproteobacteria bacterium]|jgi:urease accessory protein
MKRATKVEHAGHWPASGAVGRVTLTYDDRHRRRLRLKTEDGMDFLLDLDRAALLRDGDGLLLDDGGWVAVGAAPEDVVDVRGETPRATARLAWHLGNRHLPVQILEDGAIRFRYDHVIEEMVIGLGGAAERKRAPFTPEGGAYEGGGHHHGHHHHHDDTHDHHHHHHHGQGHD